MATLERHLADYLLNLAPSGSRKQHRAECIALWREKYGDKLVGMVQKAVEAKKGKS